MHLPDPAHDPGPFLDRLAARDPGAAAFARKLIDEGCSVRSLVGPVQMDVWELIVQRGGCKVRFGIERGYADGVGIVDATGHRPIARVVSEWARANAVVLPSDDSGIGRAWSAHWAAALDWLDDGNDTRGRQLP